ncbi:MAG TPA: DMT family transporter [Calditrichaeota bacterium]|nr:DMT family transporter [Calditrichota bacterium]
MILEIVLRFFYLIAAKQVNSTEIRMQSEKQNIKTILILFTGIFVLSWSSIFIRMMGDLHPLTITFYRLIFSSLFLLPFARQKKDKKGKLTIRSKGFLIVAGFFLALHFYTWIFSLQLTTIGNSIFLESTHPLFAWLLSRWFLKEKAGKNLLWAGLAGLAGMFIITSDNLFSGSSAFAGDSLALVSAFFIAAYLIIARISREKLPILRYLFWVYSIAAGFILLALILLEISFWSVSAADWRWLILLALGPNLIGHSVLNWTSQRMPVYKVNLALLSESVLATMYAALLLAEFPPLHFYPGAVLILTAIYLGVKTIKIREL